MLIFLPSFFSSVADELAINVHSKCSINLGDILIFMFIHFDNIVIDDVFLYLFFTMCFNF